MPTDYDPDQPYALSTLTCFSKLQDIPAKNVLEVLTKEEVTAKRARQNGGSEHNRQSAQPQFAQPKRSSIGDAKRVQDVRRSGRQGDASMPNMQERPPMSSHHQAVTPQFGPAKRFRIEDTPPSEPKRARLLTFS